MTKLYVSTPCYGGLCLEKYASSILFLEELCHKKGIEFILDLTENESLVHRARNVNVGRFMQKSDAEYFMFIDADIHFDAQSVITLMESGHDVSVACYPKKCIDWKQAEECMKNGDTREPKFLSSQLVVNPKPDGNGRSQVDAKGFAEVLDGPTGFMLIKRSVFKKMEEHYPELWVANDHANRDFDTYCALFDCMIDPKSRRYLSEDYAFCRRWQNIGGKIYAHVSTTLGHVGNLPFGGALIHRLKDKA